MARLNCGILSAVWNFGQIGVQVGLTAWPLLPMVVFSPIVEATVLSSFGIERTVLSFRLCCILPGCSGSPGVLMGDCLPRETWRAAFDYGQWMVIDQPSV